MKDKEQQTQKNEETQKKELEVVGSKNELGVTAQKNHELFDAYVERIEGAVFKSSGMSYLKFVTKRLLKNPVGIGSIIPGAPPGGAKREFTKVILDCNKAIGLNPSLADAYYNRGSACFFLGKYIESSCYYQKSIELNIFKKADAYFNRSLCFQKLDHLKKAYHEFLKAKELGSQKAVVIIEAHCET